jgi:transcriptional regulator of acetoin/glycerol metabolism
MLNPGFPSVSSSDVAVTEHGSIERQQLIDALQAADGNQSQAARLLGINRVTVWNRMRKYRINLKREIKR